MLSSAGSCVVVVVGLIGGGRLRKGYLGSERGKDSSCWESKRKPGLGTI